LDKVLVKKSNNQVLVKKAVRAVYAVAAVAALVVRL
jgi:hypothetical protein